MIQMHTSPHPKTKKDHTQHQLLIRNDPIIMKTRKKEKKTELVFIQITF